MVTEITEIDSHSSKQGDTKTVNDAVEVGFGRANAFNVG